MAPFVSDVTIEAVSKILIIVVLLLSFVSLLYIITCMAFGIFVYVVSSIVIFSIE